MQGCDVKLLVDGARATVKLADEINESLGCRRIKVLDLGGGIPVDYASDDSKGKKAVTPETYCAALRNAIPKLFADDPEYRIVTEYGRYISSKAGVVVSKVEYTKEVGGRRIATIHAGADLFLRTCYTDNWPHRVSAWDSDGNFRDGSGGTETWDVVGPLCFRGDVVASGIQLPSSIESGDYIVIHDAGAYTMSMFSSYNSRQKPPVYKVDLGEDGETKLTVIVEGESKESVLKGWGWKDGES